MQLLYFLRGNNNTTYLNISPENFITWIIDGEKKFYYDADTNGLIFGGTVQTGEDCRVGGNLKVGYDKDGNWKGEGWIQFENATISQRKGVAGITISADQGIYLSSTRVYTNKGDVAVQNDIDDLQKQINNLQSQIDALKSTYNNPII